MVIVNYWELGGAVGRGMQSVDRVYTLGEIEGCNKEDTGPFTVYEGGYKVTLPGHCKACSAGHMVQ